MLAMFQSYWEIIGIDGDTYQLHGVGVVVESSFVELTENQNVHESVGSFPR
jgi:hypothetical protein